MRFTRYEIRKRLDVRSDPCALFELINRAEVATNFRFALSIPNGLREIRVTTEPQETLKLMPSEILDGRIPELFDSQGWDVRLGAKRWTLDSAYNEIAQPSMDITPVSWQVSDNVTNDYRINITRYFETYGPNGIPPVFSQQDTIRRQVFKRTWLGGLAHLEANRSLTWSNLGTDMEMSNVDRRADLDAQGMSPVIRIASGPVTVLLVVSTTIAGIANRSVRIASQGTTTWRDWLHPIADELEKGTFRFKNWICEIDCPELVSGSELVTSISSERKADIEQIVRKLASNDIATTSATTLRQSQMEDKRIQLEKRIMIAKSSDQVRVGSRLLMATPTSENATVALFHLLEGCNGLPFDHYRTRSWTSQSGLDSIADFRLTPDELTRVLEPVEFEYKFDNYVLHRHEPEHTALIVCWTVGDGRQRDRRLTRHRLGWPWLWAYHSDEGVTVPVAEIRAFPTIECTRSQERIGR